VGYGIPMGTSAMAEQEARESSSSEWKRQIERIGCVREKGLLLCNSGVACGFEWLTAS
jgi:hypothetical protein